VDISIGLPSTIPGTDGAAIVEWARRAERRGFTSLGVIDRLVYDNYESLITLAAAAAVTERIKLFTAILIAPYRGSAAYLAKQAASIDRLSHGRLVLGMAVGGREDDFAAAGADFTDRGKRFDKMLDEFDAVWRGESRGMAGAVGPRPTNGRPQVVIGGANKKAFDRMVKHGDGWIAGGAPPDQVAELAKQARAAWEAGGRTNTLRISALAYFSLGADAADHAKDYLGGYYGFLGDVASMIVAGALTDAERISGALQAYSAAGVDELILFPANPDPAQVDLLADVAL
jgi:alkanesulfonate monooxygenase SsuD/methylene tetrahydromethanopterin reductase-like flavin-dependent oxidoreductase (luciferase family)